MSSDRHGDNHGKELVCAAESDKLKRLIQEGIDSGPGIPAEEVFDRLRRKYATLSRE